MKYKVISFYKYVGIKDSSSLKDQLIGLCNDLDILGRILIGEEGINGAICGEEIFIETFKNQIKKINDLQDLTFREQYSDKNVYHKLVVRVRKEIVHFGEKIDISKIGKYIESEELKSWLDNKEDVILIDARNIHETIVGKFENAVTLPIKTFRELPKNIDKIKQFKNKKIVTYCTGGIRCEKVSAYLNQNGFKDVNQLKGGIIDYINKFPNDHFKGSCFVFDDRLVNESRNPISDCSICGDKSDIYINCHNLDCDKLFICCKECQEKMNKTCSEDCKNAPRQRKIKKEINGKVIGNVENYYNKIGVALIKINDDLRLNSKVGFIGKTTNLFEQDIKELRDYNENQIEFAKKGDLITLHTVHKVRKNDNFILLEDDNR